MTPVSFWRSTLWKAARERSARSPASRFAGGCGILDPMRFLALLIVVVSCSAYSQQDSAEQIFARAVEAQRRGDYARSIDAYQRFLKLEPQSAAAHANLGVVLSHEGRYDDAIKQYKLALPNIEDKDGLRLNLGLAYYKKGDLRDAAPLFAQVQTQRPHDAQAAILLGDCDLKLGLAPDALKLLQPLESENAANPDLQYLLGEVEIAVGKPREGAERLNKLALATNSADAYAIAGTAWMKVNEFEQARTALDAAAKLNPDLPGIFGQAALAHDKTGDQAGAEPLFREALKRNPQDFESNLYLGAILYKRRQVDEALPFLTRALALKPDDTMARYELGMWNSTAGKYAEAVKELETVVQKDPDWLQPHLELATLYYRVHRPEDGARERAIIEKLTAEQQTKGPGKP
jgi:tetratricopeptide (TPR) repeat protein